MAEIDFEAADREAREWVHESGDGLQMLALAYLHLRAPKGELEEARADSRDVCWHCKDALIPEPPPHCESCPDYECGCDDEDCEAEGCLEREEKHRAALSRARGEGT